jgi:deazaflavin-dependent oxidoreductase (nitroreductase family)
MEKPGRTIPVHFGSSRATNLRRAFFGPLTQVLNPHIMKIAGTVRVRPFGIVEHRGRRSGRTYSTPLAVRGFPGGFLIPLTFGPEADWCRNVLSAGECVIRWKGTQYTATEPEIVDAASAGAELRAATSRVERFLLRLMGTRLFLRLLDASGQPAPLNQED